MPIFVKKGRDLEKAGLFEDFVCDVLFVDGLPV